jgi:hypothetical protein
MEKPDYDEIAPDAPQGSELPLTHRYRQKSTK